MNQQAFTVHSENMKYIRSLPLYKELNLSSFAVNKAVESRLFVTPKPNTILENTIFHIYRSQVSSDTNDKESRKLIIRPIVDIFPQIDQERKQDKSTEEQQLKSFCNLSPPQKFKSSYTKLMEKNQIVFQPFQGSPNFVGRRPNSPVKFIGPGEKLLNKLRNKSIELGLEDFD
eukprot:EST49289.1 Hypothetical protein SS50377_10512 [Spironucleus salmonicida]